MKLRNNITLTLPEDRFVQEMDKDFSDNDQINIKVLDAPEVNGSKPNFRLSLSEFDVHVQKLSEIPVKAEYPAVLYLTQQAIELSVEISDGEYLEFNTYYRTEKGVHLIFEILEGIRIGGKPVGIPASSVNAAVKKCLELLKADEAKKARLHEEALQRGAAIPGAYSVYDSDIAFDLPNGYEFYWKDLGDGDKGGRIITDIAVKEDGEKDAGYMIVVDAGTARQPMDNFFEALVQNSLENASNAISCRLSHDPETVLYTSMTNLSVFGSVFQAVGITVLMSVSANKVLQFTWAGNTEDAAPDHFDRMEKMLKAVQAVRIHNRPVRLENADAKALWAEMYPREHDGPVYEVPMGIALEVKENGKTVSRKEITHEEIKKTKTETKAPAAAHSPDDPEKHLKELSLEEKHKIYKKYVTKNPEIDFSGKTFVFAGLLPRKADPDTYPLIRKIKENRGYISHTLVVTARYLVIDKVDNTEDAKMRKAVEMIYSGSSLKIIWLKDLEQKLGFAPGTSMVPDATAQPPAVKAEAAPAPSQEKKVVAGSTTADGIHFSMLDFHGSVVPQCSHMSIGERYLELPEGITKIETGAFMSGQFEIVRLPASLRTIEHGAFANCRDLRKVEFREGLLEIGPMAFEGCVNLQELHLPESLQKVDPDAFADELFKGVTHITVYLSGSTARRLYANRNNVITDETAYAAGFVIDGSRYNHIEDYINNPKPAPRTDAVSALRAAQVAGGAKRDEIRRQIAALERERDSLKGLFAGFKKKKIQQQIDELRERLRDLG